MPLSERGTRDVQEGSFVVEGATLLLWMNKLGTLLDLEHMQNKIQHVHSLAFIHTSGKQPNPLKYKLQMAFIICTHLN
jgi:hypothetical protein